MVEALLNATQEVSLFDLMKAFKKKYEDLFKTQEFYDACTVIAFYLGILLLDDLMEEEKVNT